MHFKIVHSRYEQASEREEKSKKKWNIKQTNKKLCTHKIRIVHFFFLRPASFG